MKKYLLKLLVLACVYSVFMSAGYSQTTKTVGASGADYATLGAAFTAINGGSVTGQIVLQVIDNTTETASAVLNASGTGSASYTSVTIYPTVAGKSITGSLAAPLIDLNGADNVTIDGRVMATGSDRNMIITNTSTSAIVGTSTIRFIADASTNTVQYCYLKGSATVPASNAGGTVLFSTGTSTGNLNNTIINNDLTCSSDANRPTNTIMSYGTSLTVANTGITISNNNIYDFFNRANASFGINLSIYTSSATISGNSFYETQPFVTTNAGTAALIVISLNSTLGGHSITGNYIGGSAANCTGTWTKTGKDNEFRGITVNTTNVNIQSNTIKGFDFTNSNLGSPSFYGIHHADGNATIQNNIIGESSGTGSIYVKCTAQSFIRGIYATPGTGQTVTIRNNTISSVTGGPDAATYPTTIQCIYSLTSANSTLSITGNNIGDVNTPSSINAASVSTAAGGTQIVAGIFNTTSAVNSSAAITISGNTVAQLRNGTTNTTAGTYGGIVGIYSNYGTVSITSNTVRDLTIANANNNTTNAYKDNTALQSVAGIAVYGAYADHQTITGNNINNLSNTYASFAGRVNGIYYYNVTANSYADISSNEISYLSVGSTGTNASTIYGIQYNSSASANNTCSKNFIYDLTTSITGTGSTVYGACITAGVSTWSNNIIALGGTTSTTLYGLYDTGAALSNTNLYYNTVYISGNLPAATVKHSYALYSAAATNTRDFRNNIFTNTRSNTGSAAAYHYTRFFNYSSNTNLTLDYNDYYPYTISGAVTGFDTHSRFTNPSFSDAGGGSAASYLPSNTSLIASTTTGITADYAGTARSATLPAMGAYEYTVSAPASNVTVSAGASSNNYMNLTEAFAAINNGTFTGDISVAINGNTYEAPSAVLNASGSGSASYSTVSVYPTVAGCTILGSNSGAPVIDINGADNVTIDGRVNKTGSTVALTISNTSTSQLAGTSTIRFINDAINNTLTYCNILGSSQALTGGNVLFSTGTTTGNDGNTVSYCIIGPVGVNYMTRGIYSYGTNTSYDLNNSNIQISNCEIFDFFHPGLSSYGIYAYLGSTDWTISNNKIYQSSSKTITITNVSIFGISCNNTTYGKNFTVTGNTVGGANNSGTGSTTFSIVSGVTLYYRGISLNVLSDATNTCTISNNTVRGTLVDGGCYGIYFTSTATALSKVNINNNIVNAIGGMSSIAAGGIYGAYANNITINGNRVYNLSKTYASGTNSTLRGIQVEYNTTCTISSNEIAQLNNYVQYNPSDLDYGGVIGISVFANAANGVVNIYNNFITELLAQTTARNGINAILIKASSAAVNYNLFYNTIYLTGSMSAGGGSSDGVCAEALTGGTIDLRNNIIINNITPGAGGSSAAYRRNGTSQLASTYHAGSSNNNNYYVAPGNYIYANSTESALDINLSTFKTRLGLNSNAAAETNSISENTTFVVNGLTYNLHLHETASSLCKNGGIPITSPFAITSDYDGDQRDASTPDIGADEFTLTNFIWTGASSTYWNTAANWNNNSVPSGNKNVQIPAVVNQPVVDVAGAACNNLTLASGAVLTISPGSSLTVNGTFTNNAGVTGLVIKSDATGDGSYIGPATEATVERYVTGNAWHLLSPSVSGAYSASYLRMFMKQYDESTDNFGALLTSTIIPLSPGTGSLVWSGTTKTISFTGTINSGTISISAPRQSNGFSLAGNPYASAIDWNAASGWTKTNLAGSIWIWNPVAGQYSVWNGSTGSNGGSQYIAMGQGFFVQATSAGSLSIPESARVGSQASPLFRSAKVVPEQIRLLVSGNNFSDEAVVAIESDALATIDYRYDAMKITGSADAPQISTVKDGKNFTIASLSSVDSTTIIPVNFNAGVSGNYRLNLSNTINTGSLNTFLIDKLTGTVLRTDLQPEYTFNASPSDIGSRFEIIFSTRSVITSIKKQGEIQGLIKIWNSGRNLNVEIPTDEKLKVIEIYSLSGIRVKTITGGNMRDIDTGLNGAMYIVRVITNRQLATGKIVIR